MLYQIFYDIVNYIYYVLWQNSKHRKSIGVKIELKRDTIYNKNSVKPVYTVYSVLKDTTRKIKGIPLDNLSEHKDVYP
jgi:hypothetical protein